MAVLEIRNLTKDYVDDEVVVHALRGVDLVIEAGEFMAIAGPSGSGKTTLLNIIGGLDAPTGGSVAIDGVGQAGLSPNQLCDLRRDKIGFVFQAYNLFPILTAAENAEYVLELKGVPAAARRARVRALFEQLGLTRYLDTMPMKMSGGQQQRVAVARAIAAEPTLVLADEPTANLDQTTGESLIELMRKLNREQGVTFVFSTHDPMVLGHADRVVRLMDGQIVADERKSPA
ncbi:MAG: ABC transporter ATP-binding protein [Pseudomonadota bacterium]